MRHLGESPSCVHGYYILRQRDGRQRDEQHRRLGSGLIFGQVFEKRSEKAVDITLASARGAIADSVQGCAVVVFSFDCEFDTRRRLVRIRSCCCVPRGRFTDFRVAEQLWAWRIR